MKSSPLWMAVAVSVVVPGFVAVGDAQAPTPTKPPLKQVAYLKAPLARPGDHFGCGGELDGHAGVGLAMSADGTTIAVAAPHYASNAKGINGDEGDESMHGAGAVFIYTRQGTNLTKQAFIKASNPGDGDEFGHYIALSADGNTLAVSAYYEGSNSKGINGNQEDDSIPQAGAVYIFTRTGTTWAQQAYIKASNTGEAGTETEFGNGDQFGFSLTLSGDGNTLAVGAISEDSNAWGPNGNQEDNSFVSAGAVYVFTRAGSSWTQQAYLKSLNNGPGDLYGYTVSLNFDGNTLAVGSYDERGSTREINGLMDRKAGASGAVFIWQREGTFWTHQAYVKSPINEAGDQFGQHVQLSDDGNYLAVSTLDEDCLATGINPKGPCTSDRESDTSVGSVDTFVRKGSTWTHETMFKAPNAGKQDWYGARFALSGDGNTLVITAALEDSPAQGLDDVRKMSLDTATEAGSAYMYTRRGSTWTYNHYIKGSNTREYDEFGSSIAISRDGKILLISARGEDSGATGLNGNQKDTSVDEAGAVYMFMR